MDGAKGIEVSEPLIGVAEVMRMLGIGKRSVYRLCREGELPYYAVPRPGCYRFKRSEVAAWRDAQKREVFSISEGR